jgi:hypothetical protein
LAGGLYECGDCCGDGWFGTMLLFGVSIENNIFFTPPPVEIQGITFIPYFKGLTKK